MTETQTTELKDNHNFGGQCDWYPGKVNNIAQLPENITLINSFENDIMNFTNINTSAIGDSSNLN